MSFFDLSHVTDVPIEGSIGPPVSFLDMISQGFKQQFRVDSARAIDNELRNRWLESLRLAGISSGPATDPVGHTTPYRAFAQHVSGQPVETNIWTSGLFGKQDPLDPIREMIHANERIKELNDPKIKTFEQILEEVAEMQRSVEEETGSMYERSGTGGFVASLIGAMAGSFTTRDPLNIITAPIGAGRTVATKIASEMAIAAGVVGYTELAEVAPARQIVGLPERDPLFNIAAATFGAGVIRGGIEGVGYGISRLRAREDIDFDARDSQLMQAFEANADKPSARAGAMILDDATFIERNNPFGESRAAQERFIAELTEVQRAMNGAPMTAVGRVLPPLPFEYIKKAADFEIVKEQAPDVWAKMETAKAKVQDARNRLQGVANDDLNSAFLLEAWRFNAKDPSRIAFDTRLREIDQADITPLTSQLNTRIKVAEDAFVRSMYPNWPDTKGYQAFDDALFQNYMRIWFEENALSKYRQDAQGLPPDFSTTRPYAANDRGEIKPQNAPDRNTLLKERRAATREYIAAHRAVEAEAARLNTLAAKAQDAQQAEGANILAQAYGRPFIGPLLRYNNVEALVERINKVNETLDEAEVALFAKQAEGEGDTAKLPNDQARLYTLPKEELETIAKSGPREAEVEEGTITREQAQEVLRGHLPYDTWRTEDLVDQIRSVLIGNREKDWVRQVTSGRAGLRSDLQRDYLRLNGAIGALKAREYNLEGLAADLSENLRERGWSETDANEVLTHRLEALRDKPALEAWRTEDGRVDIGLRDPVDPDFRFVTDEGEMTVAAAMRDLQDDADLVEAIRVCSI